MKVFFAILIFAAVPLVNAKCYQDIDKFEGTEFHWCGAWGTGGIMLGGLGGLDPIPYAIKSKENEYSYYIKLVADRPSWLFISKGDKLLFLIDGDVHEIAIEESSDRKVSSGNKYKAASVVETVFLPITKEFIQLIAEAEKVEFALYTEKGRLERKLHRGAKKHYGELLKKLKNVNSK